MAYHNLSNMAYDSGYKAYEDGKRIEQNPYEPLDTLYAMWNKGYQKAQSEDLQTTTDYLNDR